MRIHITGAAVLCFAAVLLSGCTTERRSAPARTATEQLLISTAADRAAHALALSLPQDKKLFIDATHFDGPDSKYAISAIRGEFLRRGGHLATDQKTADVIVEISLGALSIDENSSIIGIPEFNIPVPMTGDLTVPEVALFKKEVRQGVAKFSAFSYDAKSGALVSYAPPDLGTSHKTQWVVALFISWNTSDINPDADKADDDSDFPVGPLPTKGTDLPNWL